MSSYAVRQTPGDTAWFRHDRFGMFIHWGLYAMPARHEWVKTRECRPEAEYEKYFRYFQPDLFDARAWARQARAAGMRYAVLTTKHHEGFCLWDSRYTDYKVTNTPARRDVVREFVEAFRAEGLRVGFYYSLLDWHHPDFPIDMNHPRRKDPDAQAQNEGRDMRRYAQYMRNQVAELLTGYGKIDILWLDFSYGERKEGWMRGKGKEDWESEALIALARRLQPGILINNRAGIEQDLWTPEQHQPTQWLRHPDTGELVTWEACQTFSGSWGYHRDEASWKSPDMLIRMLVNTVSLGGNLLMNVGPTARGYFDARARGGPEGVCGLDAAARTVDIRLHHGGAGVSCRPAAGLPHDAERGRLAPVSAPVRLSVCLPAAARPGGKGGLRAVPGRRERGGKERGAHGPLRRRAARRRRPAGAQAAGRPARYAGSGDRAVFEAGIAA